MKKTEILSLAGFSVSLIILGWAALAIGEIEISWKNALAGLFFRASDYDNRLIHGIRLPRVASGALIGATLSISGLMTGVALRNPLADSGILGIQSGATVGALCAILLLPGLAGFYPLFAFTGGLAAFFILILASFRGPGIRPNRIILTGVAINSVGTSLIGIITLLNVYRIRDALSWMSGSLAGISASQMRHILLYSVITLAVSVVMLPVLKILLLQDEAIVSLGYKPAQLRIFAALTAVMLASIGVAYAGIISFIGIVAPQLARKLFGHSLNVMLPATALIGALLTVGTDFLQRIVFAPREIPAGILIGMLGAPLFITLARRENHG